MITVIIKTPFCDCCLSFQKKAEESHNVLDKLMPPTDVPSVLVSVAALRLMVGVWSLVFDGALACLYKRDGGLHLLFTYLLRCLVCTEKLPLS